MIKLFNIISKKHRKTYNHLEAMVKSLPHAYPYYQGRIIKPSARYYYNLLLQKIFTGEYELENVYTCYCGNNNLEILSLNDRFGLPFGTKICKTCGLILLSPRIKEKYIDRYYSEIYWGLMGFIPDDENEELSTQNIESTKIVFELLNNHFKTLTNEILEICEIGCGSGLNLYQIQKLFKKTGKNVQVTGCDFSESAIKKAQNKGLNVKVGGVDALGEKKYDIIIVSHIVEHFYDLDYEIKKIKALMKPDSIIYVEVPGVCNLYNNHNYEYNYNIYTVMAHIYNFNLSSLNFVMHNNGFKLLVGDEYVRSVFKISEKKEKPLIENNYDLIMQKLNKARTNNRKLKNKISYKIKQLLKKAILH